MKKCPFCAEQIQSDAVKCKHCGEWLPESPSPAEHQSSQDRSDGVPVESLSSNSDSSALQIQPLADGVAPSSSTPLSRLFWAWLLATWLCGSYQVRPLLRPGVPSTFLWLAIGLAALNAAVAVSVLATFIKWGAPPSPHASPRSGWGLAWRATVATFVGLFLKMAAIKTVSIDPAAVDQSFGNNVIWEIMSVAGIVVATWALFSPNRRTQLGMLFSAIRGY